jgi:hypothetical protein
VSGTQSNGRDTLTRGLSPVSGTVSSIGELMLDGCQAVIRLDQKCVDGVMALCQSTVR